MYHQIRCFLEVANYLSFTKAAERLCITQQAVTKQINFLEQRLGVILFYRTTRSVTLTVAGKILRDEFFKINFQIDEVMERVHGVTQDKNSIITIGFFAYFSRKKIILPIMDFLSEKYPEVYFDIKLYDLTNLKNRLHDGELDICISTSNHWQSWPSVKTNVLRNDKLYIVFSKRHPLSEKPDFSISDLKNDTRLMMPRRVIQNEAIAWDSSITYRNKLLCHDLITLLVHLESGHGFAILPKNFEGSDSDTLIFKDIPIAGSHVGILCVRRENMENPLVLEVSREIENKFIKI